MRVKTYSHQSGDKYVPQEIARDVKQALNDLRKTLQRRSATAIRREILELLHKQGWPEEVRISSHHGLTLTSKREKTALCLQTGNMARFYADLLKIQSQFLDNKISSAIYILPTSVAAKRMGQNLASYERMTSELKSMFLKVITVPLLVYGFEEE